MMKIPFDKIRFAGGVASSVYSVIYAVYGSVILYEAWKATKQARKAGSDPNEDDIIDIDATDYRVVE